ncbi:hypothetical protein IWQ62_006290 [Dispira parvispora]|uniref:Phosducin domain-containing protein n=1 Tax=Dispira parvispora TaxID=1520584 RepID=A0A9W8E082_9FUNG|nr:hypothetical protein IWQ62_006290 [Dispira parvispora]
MAEFSKNVTTYDETVDRLAHRALDHSDNDDDLDDLLEKDDHILTGYREQRLEALKSQISDLTSMRTKGHGQYSEVADEKEALTTMTNTDLCVTHFYHPDFQRCRIVDKHLQILATKYFTTKFVKVNVSHAPFLVQKLGIQVLPCVIPTVNGISQKRLVGFDDLGNKDDFKTSELEAFLSATGVLKRPNPSGISSNASKSRGGQTSGASSDETGDSDDDNDDSYSYRIHRGRTNNGFVGAQSHLKSHRSRQVDDSDDDYA